MSTPQSNASDTKKLLRILRGMADLFRRLDLSKEAAAFEQLIAWFSKKPTSFDIVRHEVQKAYPDHKIISDKLWALQESLHSWIDLVNAFDWLTYPKPSSPGTFTESRKSKSNRKPKNVWQLDGESDLRAVTIPDPPKAGAKTTIKLTLSNSYSPQEDLKFFVRIGNPRKPTDQDDLDSARDWIQARLVKELVYVKGKEILRSKAKEPFKEETPWEGVYQTKLALQKGRLSIEIKIVSSDPELLTSCVLSDWNISVRAKGVVKRRNV
jgi:hypothetical protein